MKRKHKYLFILLIWTTLAGATTGRALDNGWWQDTTGWFGERFAYVPSSGTIFSPQELSLDLFGSLYDADRKVGRTTLHGQWGGGLGANYFVTRELGVMVDGNIAANGRSFFDYLHASVAFRWPFDSCGIAPYGFLGIGYDFDPNEEFTEHAGVGAEYRLNSLTGFFVDTRYVWTDKSTDYWIFRAGVRFVF